MSFHTNQRVRITRGKDKGATATIVGFQATGWIALDVDTGKGKAKRLELPESHLETLKQ